MQKHLLESSSVPDNSLARTLRTHSSTCPRVPPPRLLESYPIAAHLHLVEGNTAAVAASSEEVDRTAAEVDAANLSMKDDNSNLGKKSNSIAVVSQEDRG